MKNLRFVFVSLMILLQASTVLACGISVIPSDSGWTYGNDSDEQSFINLENGREKLIISRGFENGSKDTVWVVPLPSDPTSIKVDVLADTPKFSGYNVIKEAHNNLDDIKKGLLATQIYTLPFLIEVGSVATSGTYNGTQDTLRAGAPTSALRSDVVIYQHLEKEGMVAEVLSAANSDALYQYLKEKGLNVQKDSISILQEYIGKDFSFVASWISPENTSNTRKGLLMDFPAKEIFYPLHPGSVYPGKGLPETITVVGHVSPKLYADIKDNTEVEYFYSPNQASLAGFFTSQAGFGFTRIVVNVPPSKLTQDLHISNSAPLKILNAQFIDSNPFLYGVLLMLLISFIAVYLSCVLLFSSSATRPSLLIFTLVGCLTIIGTILGSMILLKEKRLKFILSFSLIFILLSMLSTQLLLLIYK